MPDPTPRQGDLILKIRAATVCGTAMHILYGCETAGVRHPSVIGHEFAGKVVEAPPGAAFELFVLLEVQTDQHVSRRVVPWRGEARVQ